MGGTQNKTQAIVIMSKTKSVSDTILPWLRANGMNLAALTSQDTRALQAATQIMALYNSCDSNAEHRCIAAFGQMVTCMQPQTRYLAFHAIAHVGDWGFRQRMWEMAELPDLGAFPRCKNE